MGQVGEQQAAVEQDFQRGFTRCVAENKHRREPYFILVTGDWYSNFNEFHLEFHPRQAPPASSARRRLRRSSRSAFS